LRLLDCFGLKYEILEENKQIWDEWLEEEMPPSRAAYGVVDLPGGALIEIVCEAFRGCGGA